MKDLFRTVRCCSLGLVLVWAGFGCTDEESGLFIQGNVALTPPSCDARAESSSALLLAGVLDVGLKLDYDATLLVGSQLTPRSDKQNLRTETMITVIEGAEVHLFDDSGALVTEFTVPASGVIRPDPSDDPGFGIINATLIPQSTGLGLAAELVRGQVKTQVAEVKVFGRTVGGLEVESAAIRYVIKVCLGCLVNYPAIALQNGVCSRAPDQSPELPCFLGQDAVVDCRACAATNPICSSPG
ncbi:MAG: hypothetical protein ABI895_06250 [Deltaproteobacteria bacterium]